MSSEAQKIAALYGVLAPAVLAGLVFAIGWRPWRAGAAEPNGRAVGGLAVGAAFFLAGGLLFGWPALPTAAGKLPVLERVAWIALLAGPVLLLELRLGKAVLLLRAACAAAASWYTLEAFGRAEDLQLLAILAAGMVVLGTGLQLLAARVPGPSLPLVLMAVGSASAVAIGVPVSAKFGQLEGALCAAFGAAWVLALWRHRVTIHGPALSCWVLVHGALLACAWIYGLPLVDTALLAVAPLAAWLAELPVIRRRPAWQVGAARVFLALAPALVPIARALLTEADPYGS